ncbi:hypothetical protein GGH91_005711, partial [Coemansia sp. RSA 2671]
WWGLTPTDTLNQSDSDGFVTQGKRTLEDHSTTSTDSGEALRYNQRRAINRFALLEDDEDSSMEDPFVQTQSTGHFQSSN